MAFDGTRAIPAALGDVEGSLHLKGTGSFQKLYPIVARHAAAVDATSTTSPVTCGTPASEVDLPRHQGTVGDSDLSGDFTVDVSGKRHLTTADLTSPKAELQGSGRIHRPAAGRRRAHGTHTRTAQG